MEHSWDFIEPWCAHLCGRLALEPRRDVTASCSVRRHSASWLRVTLPPDGKGANWRRIQDLREAVELLGAVARVDHAAFRELLVHACGVTALRDPSVMIADTAAAAGCANNGDGESGGTGSREVPRVTFAFAFTQYETLDISWGATLYNQFFLALDHGRLSDAFRDAMARVDAIQQLQHQSLALGASSAAWRPGSIARIPVEIVFAPPTLPVHWCAPYLQSVLEVVQAIRDESDCSSSGGGQAFPFALQAVRLSADRVVLSEATMTLMRELLALGVDVPLFSLDSSSVIMTSPRTCMGQFVAEVTGCASAHVATASASEDTDTADADDTAPTSLSVLASAEPSHSGALHLRGPRVDAHQFGAFCSALASAQRIEHVHLSEIVADERGAARFAKWQWLALAFFRAQHASQSSISSLRIDDTSLCEDDVRAVVSVVRAAHPAKALVSVDSSRLAPTDDAENSENTGDSSNSGGGVGNADPADSHSNGVATQAKGTAVGSVLLSKGTRILVDPQHPDAQHRSIELGADDHFLVMKDDPCSAFVDVLVPGYARCAVARDAVLYYLCDSEAVEATQLSCEPQSTTSPSPRVAHTYTRITSLHIEFKHVVQASTLQAFIALVGAPLECLVLKTRAMTSESLDVVLRTCSRLQRLSFDMVEDGTLAVLVQAYERRHCQITSLTLQGLELESDEVTEFAHALGTRGTALASKLHELSIGERLESYALDEVNLFALLSMLEVNTRLEYLELFVEHALFDSFAPLFHEFHGQPLPVAERSMSLSSRLAFLSVLGCSRGYPHSDEMHSGDDSGENKTSRWSSETGTVDSADERAAKRPRWHSSPLPTTSQSSLSIVSRSASMSASADTSRLDNHVVALIFEFAATPKRRVVRVVEFH